MTWQAPKINWKSSDYINIEDWVRIEGNTEYVADLLELTLETMLLDRSNTGFPFADYLNFLSRNIEALPLRYVTPLGWVTLKTDWEALVPISFTLFNAMENNLKLIKVTYERNQNQRSYIGEIYCGEEGGLLWL